MAKADNQYEKLAQDAAKRIERARDLGEQLTFLPDEAPVPAEGGKIGRPEGAKNKGSSQMRDWLAAQGYALPEEVIAQMAGLTAGSSASAIETAMINTEKVLAWAADGAAKEGKNGTKDWKPTGGQRLEMFKSMFTIQLRAAEALLPYGTPKASPDVQLNQHNTFIQPAPARDADPAGQARDVTPVPGAIEHVPEWQREIMQNQQVTNSTDQNSDDEIRTDEASN